MIGFGIAAVIVGYFGSGIALLWAASESNCRPSVLALVAAARAVVGIGAIINVALAAEDRGPCIRYETTMHYNPATKTVAPARRCAERGEWVE